MNLTLEQMKALLELSDDQQDDRWFDNQVLVKVTKLLEHEIVSIEEQVKSAQLAGTAVG